MSHRSKHGAQRGRRIPHLAVIVLLLLSAGFISACGGDAKDSASSGSSTNSGASASEKEVYALADKLSVRPTKIPVTKPIGKPIPSGKTIIWINCGAPVCNILGKNFAEGAKALGWTTRIVATDGTPASIQKAWKQAIVAKPDGVASSGSDPAVIGAQLKELKAADIPVVNYSVVQPKVDGITLNTGDGPNIGAAFSEPMAAWIAKDSQGKANTLYTTVPAFAILQVEQSKFEEVYKKGCPKCDLDILALPVTSLGKDAAQRIVSKLRSNPKITYIANALDDVTIGLPAALKAAGLADKVKIIGASSSATNFQYISTGQQAAGVPNDIPGLTWQMVDGMARIFTGVSTDPDLAPAPRYIITKDNVPTTDPFPFVEDYKAQFLKLWGKG